jgi:hypothetical protein
MHALRTAAQSYRPLLGREILRLQGLVFPSYILDLFKDDLLHDLGGNAFSATTCMGPLSALFFLYQAAKELRAGVNIDQGISMGDLLPLPPLSQVGPTPMQCIETQMEVYSDKDSDLSTDDQCSESDPFEGIPVPEMWTL